MNKKTNIDVNKKDYTNCKELDNDLTDGCVVSVKETESDELTLVAGHKRGTIAVQMAGTLGGKSMFDEKVAQTGYWRDQKAISKETDVEFTLKRTDDNSPKLKISASEKRHVRTVEKLRKKGKRHLIQYRNAVYLYGSSCFAGVRTHGLPSKEEMKLQPEKAQAVMDLYTELKTKERPWYNLIVVLSKDETGEIIVDSKVSVTTLLGVQAVTDNLTSEVKAILEEYPNNIGYGWITTPTKYLDLEGAEEGFVELLIKEGIEDQDKRARLVHEYYMMLALKELM